MKRAKLFKNGQSQAVRLPKEFRFQGEAVWIKKVGNTVTLTPIQSRWDAWRKSLDHFSEDFMGERNQPNQQQKREDLFDGS